MDQKTLDLLSEAYVGLLTAIDWLGDKGVEYDHPIIEKLCETREKLKPFSGVKMEGKKNMMFDTEEEAIKHFGEFTESDEPHAEQCDRCKQWSCSEATHEDGEISGAGEVEKYDRVCMDCASDLEDMDEYPDCQKLFNDGMPH